jgi:hypothetical protein
VIDLESDEMISDDHAKCTPSVGGAAPETYSPGKHKSLVSAFSNLIFSTRAKKDPSVEIAESSSFQEHSECCQEQTSSNEGTDNHYLEVDIVFFIHECVFQDFDLVQFRYMVSHHHI